MIALALPHGRTEQLNRRTSLVYAEFSRRVLDPAAEPREPEVVADFLDGGVRGDDIVISADRTEAETSTILSNDTFTRLSPAERLAVLARNVAGPLVFTTSFGLEDQALTHLIVESGIACRFATLDTGRLFPETHAVWAETEERYGIRVEAFHPRAGALEALVRERGINGFYHATEARHACCAVRKLEPLDRALAGAAAWLTGLRADQSDNRRDLDFIAYDPARRLLKVNPLLDWSREQVVAFMREAQVPYNALHDKGFLSIGCAPCTRAVAPGEPERAGRWWWEQDQARECGLHVGPDGRLVRARKTA
jgi:phosphoadenosine phosphosulfate reductase